MCGIIGIVANRSIQYKEVIDIMILKQKHRGPDETNSVFFNNCCLAHNRLNIIDLSTGQQPMYSVDQNKAIVFNGEIYGYEDIRNLLDYKYKTKSDTEVILALYEKYKEDLITHLPGMFSFAIWDDKNQSLFCGRDRFGEKPFCYAIGKNGEFIFASEIKTIIASGLVEPILNKDSLNHYLQYLYIEADKTIYENIFVLPPAHKLSYFDGKISIEKYWSLPSINKKISAEEAVTKFRSLLKNAVKKQLVADVQVGAFLSGGLDSTTIVAIASDFKDKLKTFCFGFNSSKSELPYASEVAKKYKTDHVELFAEEDIGVLLLKMADIFDEPFADSSNIPTYLISREARKHVKVILTGDGGDELFGGYAWYKTFLHYRPNDKHHDSWIALMFWKAMSRLSNKFENKYIASQASYFSGIHKNPADFHKALNQYFTKKEVEKLCLYKNNEDNRIKNNSIEDPTHYDLMDYMPGDILTKIDRASMANSIELRAPFLDVNFASFCASMPLNLKVSVMKNKQILRDAFERLWPDSVKNRAKQGFGSPVKTWLKIDSVRKIKDEFLNDSSKKIFRFISFNESRSFVRKDNYRTWILLVLSIWMEKHDFKF